MRKRFWSAAGVVLSAAVFCSSGWAVAGSEGGSSTVFRTGQVISYSPGDDGDLQKGMARPDPRFIDHGDTVTDNLTNLMWVKAPHSLEGNSQGQAWEDALVFCNDLNYAGHSDWRLPNVLELQSLISYGRYYPALPAEHPFTDVRFSYYWSSTTHVGQAERAWFVYLYHGNVSLNVKSNAYEVWPVRSVSE